MTVERKPDFIQMEHDVLAFWEEHRCFEKLREKNKGNRRFRFLDGPITANNPMGIHHAWGRSIKDIALRYKAMNGYTCHYRNGFDTQGLWVEVEVERELGFKDKKDIESYGMDRFTRKCIERIEHFSGVITSQSKRLGQWMDWDHSYFTHTDENISAIWYFLKICHENGWITQSYRPMPWCPRCGTSLSEHEMSGSYRDVTHTAVFAVAKMENADFDMLVWTTTPWTLSANVALAVNPDLDYSMVMTEWSDRPVVLAKSALGCIGGDKRTVRLMRGSELVGKKYETFFPELPAQKGVVHKIIPWSEVDAAEGCGVVHIAPGCGTEDYDLGKTFSLPEICPIDEAGVFGEEYDFLSGITAAQAAPVVFDRLRESGKLFATHEYTHSYPICWRCKTEVLFRLVREWYIRTDEIRPKLIEAAEKVKWEPPFIGKRMMDWLHSMGDWNISRKRFYGLPLPFYPCGSCGHLTVIGSKEELHHLGGEAAKALPELHRPWIDAVTVKCPRCGKTVARVQEVGDVWLDAGIAPYSTLEYFSDRAEWEKNFPAEWVIEMQEQVRLWFYSQLFMSVVITGRAPYERVQTNNWVLAEDGTKFSKTGFMIRFDEAAEKMGSDAIRYLFAGASMAGDVRFGFALGEEARRKLLGFWNIYTFFMTYAEIDEPRINDLSADNLMDKWLINRISSFVNKAAGCYESYSTPELIREFEICADEVSNWYVRVNRRRFWRDVFDDDKQSAYNALYFAIKKITQVMAPILPFMCEHIWQSMVLKYGEGEESVHLSAFPAAAGFDTRLLGEGQQVRAVIAQALKLRSGKNLKVKQPLSTLYLSRDCASVCAKYTGIILDELNIGKIIFLDDFHSLEREYLVLHLRMAGQQLKGDVSKVKALCDSLTSDEMKEHIERFKAGLPLRLTGYDEEIPAHCFSLQVKDEENIAKSKDHPPVAIHTEITPELRAAGMYREILRHCQLLRKEAGFAVSDRVTLYLSSESDLIRSAVETYSADLARETLSEIKPIPSPVMKKRLQMEEGSLEIFIA